MFDHARMPYPFMHNILNLYLVLPAAKLFGAFWGWVVTNMLATILTASLIALLVAAVADKWVSVLCYAVYLLLPLTVWMSAQPLAEATIAPFVALGVLAYVKAETNKKMWALVVLAACAAYYCRVSFLPVLFVIPIAWFAQNKPVQIKSILWTLGLLSFAVGVVIIGKIIFVQSMPGSFNKIMTNAIPGVTGNMHFLFSLSPKPIVLRELWLKVSGHLGQQVIQSSWSLQVFYLPFNLLAILSVCFCFTKKTNWQARIAHCVIALLLLHIATVIIHQNQHRYLLVITPAVLTGGALMLNKIKFFQPRARQLALILGTIVILTASSVVISARLRQEGFREKELCTILSSTFENTVPKDESLIVDATRKYNQILGYVLRPRIVIFVESGYDNEQYQTIRQRGNTKWLLCPQKSPLVEHFDISSPPVLKDFPHPYQDYALFRL
jgi:4-amino-4-deoxy-L-arabinose transferase-like glycosyltransferase